MRDPAATTRRVNAKNTRWRDVVPIPVLHTD
jgi:hypothetical protein